MEQVQKLLLQIEKEKSIKILYACETGSRAWGFPSPDSDFDIRFIYRHPVDWYLSISQSKDTIERMEGDLDITGWDLRKTMMLLKKSNVPLIERFQSPIEYYSEPGFKNNFLDLIKDFYSPTAVFFHHYSLAKKFWADLQDKNEFKLKSWFYLVRSLLSCNWIMEDRDVLPMNIHGLMKYIDKDLAAELNMMIELKSTVSESYLHPGDEHWNKWIVETFQKMETNKNKLGVSRGDMGLLNKFFLKQLNGKADN